MSNKHLRPCPGCLSIDLEITEKTYEHVYLIGDFYQCKIKCPSCGNTVIRTTDESAEHARRAAVETWNQEGRR